LPKVAIQLKPAPRGGYVARKSIPRDVAEDYGRLFGKGPAQWEAWFNSGPVNLLQARAKHREWSSLIEARITNVRAERKGEGRTLTPQGARALAGEWYTWFVAHMATNKWSKEVLAAYRDRMWEGLYSVAEAGPGDSFDNSDMHHVRPIIADEAKTAQFLAARHRTHPARHRAPRTTIPPARSPGASQQNRTSHRFLREVGRGFF
jgi:hypothetical protein